MASRKSANTTLITDIEWPVLESQSKSDGCNFSTADGEKDKKSNNFGSALSAGGQARVYPLIP